MRVAVLGATGFIGKYVAGQLGAAGHEVIGLHRGRAPVSDTAMRNMVVDRHDVPALARALADSAPGVLVDLIAYTADEVADLLTALPPSVHRLVLVSSGDVYRTYDAFRGVVPPMEVPAPLPETAPLRQQLYPYRAQATGPGDLEYSYEKILVERAARTGSRVPVTILRLPMVYGPGDRQQRVGSYLRRLAAVTAVFRLNDREASWRCTRGYVEDVAWAISLSATDLRAASQVFNVGEADALAEIEWAGAIAETIAWKGRIIADPAEPASLQAEWSVPLVSDTRRIRRVLEYREPVGRAEGLRRAVAAAA
jgi:nucleoside-diphosphate-sugar epimerase